MENEDLFENGPHWVPESLPEVDGRSTTADEAQADGGEPCVPDGTGGVEPCMAVETGGVEPFVPVCGTGGVEPSVSVGTGVVESCMSDGPGGDESNLPVKTESVRSWMVTTRSGLCIVSKEAPRGIRYARTTPNASRFVSWITKVRDGAPGVARGSVLAASGTGSTTVRLTSASHS
jgi:hypothetical protein